MKSYYFFEKQICNESGINNFSKGTKCAIFENLSTTPNIESLPLCVLGNPRTKSILTASQGFFVIGSG